MMNDTKKQMLRSLICKLLSNRSTKPKGGIPWNRKQHSGISMAKKLICIVFAGYQNYYLQTKQLITTRIAVLKEG